MSDTKEWQLEFIKRLRALADPQDPRRDLLAELRRSLGQDPVVALCRVGHLFVSVPPLVDLENTAALVAGLFATLAAGRIGSQPIEADNVSLGAAFTKLADASGSESIEKRFVALLNSEKEDLPVHLRHAVSLLRAHDIVLDWLMLLKDLLAWEYERSPVQRRWARHFWAGREKEPAAEETSSVPEPTTP